MKKLTLLFGLLCIFGGVLTANAQDGGLYRRNIWRMIEEKPREGLWTIKRTDTIRINLVRLSGEMKMHKHPDAEHSIFVLEGKIDALIGTERVTLKKGDFVSIPKGVPHKYTIRGKRAIIISMDAPYYDPAKTIILK